MPIGKLARYALFAALIGITILTYLREQKQPQGRIPEPIATSGRQPDRSPPAVVPAGSGFDYYVLALSWSPSYCAAEGPRANRQQCAPDRRYGFVVHGLWPQYERGYPQDCDTSQPRDVPFAQAKQLSDIMPSTGLVIHEWRKHGSCSGLSQKDYFTVLRAARERVTIPSALQSETRQRTNAAEIEASLTAANPGLRNDALAVTCAAGRVDEVRICFNKDLSFRACTAIDRAGCRMKNLSLPAIP